MAWGVNTCHQPFLTLHNYWAELCFLQPAQRVPLPLCLTVPAGAASTCLWSWRGTGAAEPQGTSLKFLSQASNFCPKPQISIPSLKFLPQAPNFYPKPQIKAVLPDRGQEWGAAALAALQPPV